MKDTWRTYKKSLQVKKPCVQGHRTTCPYKPVIKEKKEQDEQ